jgi:hypothetical protein
MIVTGTPKRAVDRGDFTDLTPLTVLDVRWVGEDVAVEFDGDLSSLVVALVKRRIESRNANDETLRGQAEQALQNNRDFLDLPSPNQTQTLAQVKDLTRQMNGTLRMLLGQLDGIN